MPITEAQAVGRPVITSNIGAMKEIGEGSAILVDPVKPQEIRDAIIRLIQDSAYYEKVVEAGYANAAKYDVAKVANAYFKVYEELNAKQGR